GTRISGIRFKKNSRSNVSMVQGVQTVVRMQTGLSQSRTNRNDDSLYDPAVVAARTALIGNLSVDFHSASFHAVRSALPNAAGSSTSSARRLRTIAQALRLRRSRLYSVLEMPLAADSTQSRVLSRIWSARVRNHLAGAQKYSGAHRTGGDDRQDHRHS